MVYMCLNIYIYVLQCASTQTSFPEYLNFPIGRNIGSNYETSPILKYECNAPLRVIATFV